MHRTLAIFIAIFVPAALAPHAQAGTTVNEIARIKDRGGSGLQGMGLVIGLNGTGDTGKDPAVARPLMELYKNIGNPMADISDLKNAKSVAVVMVMCSIPEGGWRTNDQFDVTVSAMHNAQSLEGGMLFMAPLRGPYNDSDPELGAPWAMASGPVVIESAKQPRTGRVRGGAKMIRELPNQGIINGSFTLILNKPFSGYAAASEIASSITQNLYGKSGRNLEGLPPIATVIDDRTIRIDIPATERASTAAFVGDVLSTPVSMALLKLPAQVIYNQAAGKIVLTGDVEISPVAITSADLTITTTTPPPVPTPDNPLVETKRWTGLSAGAKETDRAKLQDLLSAFNQLNIPVADQIALLAMLEKTGKLHAKLVMD